MSFDFKEAQDVIKETLGDNYESVKSKLDKVFEIAISQKSDLSRVTTESMKRKGEIVELRNQHETALTEMASKISDYDTTKSQLETLTKQLHESNSELKHVYDSKREKLKGLYGQFDFESDKLKPLSSRFKGLDSVDTLTYQDINQELEKFELLGASKIDSAPAIPNPTKQKPEENKNVSIFGGYSLDQK